MLLNSPSVAWHKQHMDDSITVFLHLREMTFPFSPLTLKTVKQRINICRDFV